jgi:hypothetical protein
MKTEGDPSFFYIKNKSRKSLKSREKCMPLHCCVKLSENNLENQIGKTVLLTSCLSFKDYRSKGRAIDLRPFEQADWHTGTRRAR